MDSSRRRRVSTTVYRNNKDFNELLDKKLDKNYNKKLWAVLNKSRKQHLIKQ